MEVKQWIKDKAQKITDGYKDGFTGLVLDDSEQYVYFGTFACKLSKANQYDSFDELLNNL